MCWGSPDIGSKHNVGTPVASHRTHRCNTHRKLSFSSARFHDTGSEDCTAGDQWACDLLDALSHRRANDIQTPGSAKDDVDAILKGIDRARSARRFGYPFVPSITVDLQFHVRSLSSRLYTGHQVGDFAVGTQA
jgi:hypothetical protein